MKESVGTSIALALLLVAISIGVSLTSPRGAWQLAQVGSSTTWGDSSTSGSSGTSGGSGSTFTGSLPVTFVVTVGSLPICDTSGLVRRTVGFLTDPVGGGYFSLYGPGGTYYGDREAGVYDLPAGFYTWEGNARTGYMRTGTYAGAFTIDGTCPSAQGGTAASSTTNATSINTAVETTVPSSTMTVSPSPTATQTTFAPASVLVAPGTQCSPDKNMTNVGIETVPAGAAQVIFSKENGNAVTTASQGLIYLPNGTYSWRVEPKAGYAVSAPSAGTFTLSSCPTEFRVSVLAGTVCDRIDEGVPVTFNVAPTVGANFSVKNLDTGEMVPVRPGVEYFGNGRYSWSFVPPSGVAAEIAGERSGTFSVNACNTSVAAPYVPPAPGTILFFRDGKLVEPYVRQGEKVALRIDTSVATNLSLELVAREERRSLGTMTREGDSDRWLFVWSVGDIAAGEYTIFARGKHRTQGEYTAGSRILHVEPGKPVQTAVALPAGDPNMPAQETAPEEFAATPHIEIPDVPLIERIAAFGLLTPEDPSSGLPIRGVGDLIPVDAIIEADAGLPEEISTPEDLRVFCAREANDDECYKLLPERLREEAKGAIEEARTEIARAFEERKASGNAAPDADADGVNDFDEERFFGTDPKAADSDGDGRKDGEELLEGENPLRRDGQASAAVRFEDPNLGGEEKPEIFAVDDIAPFEGELAVAVEEGVTPFVITGRALPGAIVTVYIYSDPVIVRVQADESGLWSYTITKELADGSHKAYVAMTDSAGRVLAKSAPLPFVKQAAAITLTPSALPGLEESAPGLLSGGSLYAFILIITGVLGLAVIVIGFVIRRTKPEDVVL